MKTSSTRAWYVGVLYSAIGGGLTIALSEIQKLSAGNAEAAKWGLILSIVSMIIRTYIDRTVAQVEVLPEKEDLS